LLDMVSSISLSFSVNDTGRSPTPSATLGLVNA